MDLIYQALDQNGKKIQAKIEASGIKEAMDSLRRQGLFVIGINPSGAVAGGLSRSGLEKSSWLGSIMEHVTELISLPMKSARDQSPRLPLRTLLLFTRQMNMLLASGSAVVPALQAIARQMKKPVHTELVESLVRDLEGGQQLNQAMRRHHQTFDAAYVSIIAAGEASAKLTQAFERLSRGLGRKKAIRNKVLGSTAYPALLILMSVAILLIMIFFVVPRFGEMMSGLGVPLPATTKILLSTADFLRSYWPISATLGLLLISGAFFLVKTAAGRTWVIDTQTRIPLVGRLFRQFIQANFFRTLGALLESGVGLLEALDLTRGITRNKQFVGMFDTIEQSITSGQPMTDAIEASGLVDPPICQAIRTGEESGNIGPAMTFASDLLDEENSALVDTMTKLIEPVILIGMGTVVAVVAISLFLPMFDITAAVRN